MNKKNSLFLFFVFTNFLFAQRLIDYVDPFIGTGSKAWIFADEVEIK
ncbi:MAG: hypothetical protein M1391_16400 [Bacteroidetes bacterium]|nr:hypothetical protein [Bacteroidota bacterium]